MELYLLTIKDVAKRLKVNVNYVYDLIKKGHLEALKLGNMKITNVELERFISSASGNDFTNLDNVVPLEALQNKKLRRIDYMNKIINILNQDGQLVVTSRQIAEDFEKEHSSVVVRAIENLIKELEGSGQNCTHLFIETQYQNEQNKQWYKEYLLTRDGFSLLVMGFTGARALQWKLKYIEAFNKMEQALMEMPKKLSAMDQLRLQYQVIEEHEERVTKIEKVLERLEVNPNQRKAIQNARHRRVSEILGGKKSLAYQDKSFRAKVYSELGRAFNNYFDVPAYDCTPKNRFLEALDLIESYNLSAELNMELKKIKNSQLNYREVI